MKRFFPLRSTVSCLLLSLASTAFSAAPPATEYLYQKLITVPQSFVGQTVEIPLEARDRHFVTPDANNLQLVNRDNDPVPFEVYLGKTGKLKGGIEILKVSSHKKGDPEYLMDNDVLTSYHFDKKEDQQEPASVLIDLGRPQWVNRFNIVYPSQRTPHFYEIRGGLSKNRVKTVKKKAFIKQTTDLFTPRYLQYIELRFWGPQIIIDDIQIYVSSAASVYFTPEEKMSYKLLFGNPEVGSVRYLKRFGTPRSGTTMIQAEAATINPLFREDADGDSVSNEQDNCPLVSNKSQKDRDGDRVGDACDNAPDHKNRYQYDADRDNIGDIMDNCKLDYNPDQKDRDDDGRGDACDDAYAKESLINHQTKPYFVYGILVILLLGVVAIVLNERKRKK